MRPRPCASASCCCAARARRRRRVRGVEPAPRALCIDACRASRCARRCSVPRAGARSFADHFPRRPVFPATLLLDAQMRAGGDARARRLVGHAGASRRSRMTHVKMRSFIAPGQHVELERRDAPRTTRAPRGSRSTRASKAGTVATARVEFGQEARHEHAAAPAVADHRPRPGDAGRQRRRGHVVHRCSPAAAVLRRSALFDASGFSTRIAAEVKGFGDDALQRRSKAPQVRQPLASLRAWRRRAGDARRRHRADGRDGRALGLRGRHRDDGRRLSRISMALQRHSAADGELHPDLLLEDQRRQRSDGVLPQPVDGGRCAADPPLRHPRLRDVGAHRVRIGRPGDRHGAQADPPRQRRLRAGGRLRFDDQPGRARGLLPAVGGIGGQRHARAREPAVRRDAQRLCAGRRRRLPRARGVGIGAPARRAHLCRARRRRQLAVVATASPIRRPTATVRSSRCARRSPTRAPRPTTSTTSTRTARRPR